MEKKTFNLMDWFKNKLVEEKDTFQLLSNKFKVLKDDLKGQLAELKDDSHLMVPILNGLHGDSMAAKGNRALVHMSFRHQSRDISVEKLKEVYDFATHSGNVIIMVHGLMNDESIWQSEPIDTVQRLGSALEKKPKATVLYLRYNTGLHISENGRSLSDLIQKFVETYQSEIKKLVIISHSMGGLVSRSACYYAGIQNQNWTELLKKVFLIGVPNEGSYLARVAYMTQYFFRKLDPSEKDTVAKFFDVRSNGIKDLSFGYLVDEDWQNKKDGIEKNIQATKIYPLQNLDYYLIAGTVSEEKNKNRVFTFFGDGLVEKKSALSDLFITNSMISGKVNMKLFPNENHLTLLESKEVAEFVKTGLGWTD
jgi:pimeloyl-ACP methyl ester carboxylesterase